MQKQHIRRSKDSTPRSTAAALLCLLFWLLLSLLSVRVASAQGTVSFNMRTPITIHIYGPSTTAPTLSLIGMGSADNPSGTVPYATDQMLLIGAGGTGGQYGGATTLAQLIGLNGSGNPESTLVPVGSVTSFRTGGPAGDVSSVSYDVLTGSPGIPMDSPLATLAIVAWDNSSGLYPTWTQASAAWLAGHIAAGESTAFNVANIGGTANRHSDAGDRHAELQPLFYLYNLDHY